MWRRWGIGGAAREREGERGSPASASPSTDTEPSARVLDPDAVAEQRHGAFGAARGERLAEVLAEGDDRCQQRLVVMAFSQGACLTLEFAARHARRYAAVVAFTGGLIGPPGSPRDYIGDFAGTPVFIGSSDVDAHVPLERVQESTAVFNRLGATVDERIYPGMGHTINADELRAADLLLTAGPR